MQEVVEQIPQEECLFAFNDVCQSGTHYVVPRERPKETLVSPELQVQTLLAVI